MVERQKTEAITTKYHKNRGKIGLLNKEEENYNNNIADNIDLN